MEYATDAGIFNAQVWRPPVSESPLLYVCKTKMLEKHLLHDAVGQHWALVVGPKTEQPDDRGMRYHAKEEVKAGGDMVWNFEGAEILVSPTRMILIRIAVAKILDLQTLDTTLRATPVV